ncbi:hypothetical protein TSO221_20460 [Azospirillum sp. TSO22-1]|nr:hypothetical protein TSO221_20460 [Azospirillum sp. TSO22-1]
MGPAVSLSGSTMEIPASYGTRAGPNLFHSFERFEVKAEQAARFTGDGGIQRVITRVTGPDPTRIMGNLSSDLPSADLYMINPHGIVIGPKAAINVNGSFHAGTASSISFPDGSSFAARTDRPGTLSVAAPQAFGFVGEPVAIAITGGSVTAQGNLSLAGGDVVLQDAAVRSQGGTLRIVAAGAAPSVRLDAGTPARGAYTGTITAGGSEVNAGRGTIRMGAGTLTVAGASILVRSDSGGPSGGIEVAAESVRLSSSGSYVGELASLTAGDHGGGPIRFNVGDLTLDGGRIAAETISTGRGADINVDVARHLRLSASSTISANGYGRGNAGSVTVSAGEIALDGRSGIGGVVYGAGKGSAVSVTARERLSIVGDTPIESPFATQSGLFALARPGSTGDAGSVTVRTGELSLSRFGQIGSGSFGSGAGGPVEVVANKLSLGGGGTIGSSAGTTAARGGSVVIRGGSMDVADGGEVTVRSLSASPASDLHVFLTGPLSVDNGTLNASATRAAGGNVLVEAGRLVRVRGGRVTASAGGQGGGGNVTIGARSVVLDGGTVAATAVDGDGGAIRVASSTYHASPDSVVSVSSTFGFSGTIRLDTPLFGRMDPTGNTRPVNAIPAAPALASCDQGGRAEAMRAQDSLIVDKPLGRAPTAFPVPGERAAASPDHKHAGGCRTDGAGM